MSNKNTILVAVKDDIRRELILKILSSHGYSVCSLRDPARLIIKPDSTVFKIIIIDLMFLNIDLCRFLRLIKKKYPEACIIALSEITLKYSYNVDLERLVDKLLLNPINPNLLISLIKQKLPSQHRSIIMAISGGKGGVGKSVVTANMAASLATMGNRVIAVDLDFSGPNLHTMFGIRKLKLGIFDYFLREQSSLNRLIYPLQIDKLSLIGNTEDYPGGRVMPYEIKSNLIENLKKLNADYILLDLGSGTNLNVIDFFTLSDKGIIVSSPEVTSILNSYGFIKGVLYRKMETYFKEMGKDRLMRLVQWSAKIKKNGETKQVHELFEDLINTDNDAKEMIALIKQNFQPGLILNMARKTEDSKMGLSIKNIVKKYLDIDLNYLGFIYRDSAVELSIAKTTPFVLNSPVSSASNCLKEIMRKL